MSQTTTHVSTPDGEMGLLEVEAPGADRAVIVLHQASGLSPQVTAELARWGEEGFRAVAPDLFHRRGGEEVPLPSSPDQIPAFDRWLSGDEQIVTDLQAVLDRLQAEGFAGEAVAVIGFSYGGRAAFLAATQWKLGAAVSYYANGVHARSYSGNDDLPSLSDRSLQTPWLGLYGDADILLAPGELDALASEIAAAPVDAEVVRYADSGHAFDLQESPFPGSFDPAVVEDARARAHQFIDSHVASIGTAA